MLVGILIAETKIFRLGVSLICLLYAKEEWIHKRSILQKDITYYFKYQEFLGIFEINDHISDNSTQIKIYIYCI